MSSAIIPARSGAVGGRSQAESAERQGVAVGREDGRVTGQATAIVRQHGNAYDIFILVLTVMSLAIMVLLVLPLAPPEHDALRFYDNVICFVFIGDFIFNLAGSHPRTEYFVHRRGWTDLLGSIPSLGFIPFVGLLRLFRIFRLLRISRMLQGQRKTELINDVIRNRGRYATFITLLMAMLVLVTSSLLVLQFEYRSPNANITTGPEALWWAIVTITTVGYGDYFPVTELGRITAVFVMVAGVGIIGALASILASLLVSPVSAVPDEPALGGAGAVEAADARKTEGTTSPVPSFGPSELEQTRAEMARTRAEMAELRIQIAAIVAGPVGPAQG